jgi:hypothetical protein
MNVTFFDIPVPYTTGLTPTSGSVGGTNYNYVLATGNYKMAQLDMKGQDDMCVAGNAVLYITDKISIAGQAVIYISPGASLTLYMGGASTSLGGNGMVNSNTSATNFSYYGLPSNTSISLSGNAAFTGVIYAPNAALTMGGGGSTSYDFVGASVTGSVRLNGHYTFHYDEAVGRNGPAKGCIVTSWREL